MFERVGRMFWPNKSDDEASSSKKNKLDSDMEDYKQQFTMHVDDSKNILERIKHLFYDKQMCDVTLLVGGKEHNAHRLILCSTSDVFQVMLMRPEWTEWHESRVALQEPEPCHAVFHIFLEYFYTGQIILTHDNVMPILALADKYNVKHLSQMCMKYMCSNIAHAAKNNQLISWLQYTLACGHNEVAKSCQNFVLWNFEKIADTDDFVNFDSEVLIGLLQQNDLIVSNEMTLYTFTVRWLNLQIEHYKQEGLSESEIDSHMETLTEQVMLHIRFPMMTPRQLADLLLSPLIKKYKEFFVERMAIGMIYHSGQEDRIQDMCTNERGKLLFTPRLYTSDSYSSLIEVDNFMDMPAYSTRTFCFSSHATLADYQEDCICEWVIDMYPKGVWFKKFFLIVWQGTVEVPEYVIPTVRLAITCKSTTNNANVRVKIGIIVYGTRTGIEHVVNVIEKIHTFGENEKLLNIDDIIPFEDINSRATEISTPNYYLLGPNRDKLKLHIIITPITDVCSSLSSNIIFK